MKREFPSSLYPVTPSANSHLASWTYETAIDNSDDCLMQSDVSHEENDSVNLNDSGSGRQRKARTSAAVIGLAISMGASNLMVARHQGVAAAVEPPTAAAKSVDGVFYQPESTSLSDTGLSKSVSAFPTPEFSGNRHIVQNGDTFWGISQIYGVSPDEIASLNHLDINSLLVVGQSLQIPTTTESSSKSNQPQAISQLSSERQQLFSGLSNLKSLDNNLLKNSPTAASPILTQDTQIYAAITTPVVSSPLVDIENTQTASLGLDEVTVPLVPQVQIPSPYRVRQGDTIGRIARDHKLSVQDILAANSIINPNLIYIGQEITIPQSKSVSRELASTPSELKVALNSSYTDPLFSSAAPQVTLRQTLSSAEMLTTGTFQPKSRSRVSTISSNLGYTDGATQASSMQSNAFSPYLQRLKQDVNRLQERYQPNQLLHSAGLSSKLNTSASSSTLNLGSGKTIDPSFAASLRSLSLQRVKNVSDEQLLAATPSESSSYETLMQSTLGRVVSPGLPSLSSPDRYLPDASIFKGYIWPTKGSLTSGFGWRWGRMHRGIDIAGPVGTPIVAAAEGVVVTSGWNSGGYGNLVEIRHADGSLTLYAHNQRILVEEGQRVTQGQLIAEMGSTGFSTGPHLHFEIHPAGQGAANPITYLAQAKR